MQDCRVSTKWADFATFESDLDSWAFLLRNAEYIDPEFPPPMLKKSGLEDAMAVMRSWTKEEIDGFAEDRRKQEEILWVTLVKEWEAKKRAEAIAEGIEKGRTEGKAEGIAQGEKLATIGLGRKLRARGMGIEEICDLTGLSAGDLD